MVSGWIKIIGTPKELKYTQLGNINATKLSDRKKKHMEVQKWTSLSHIFLYFILVSCSEIPFESFYMKTKSLWSHIIREVLETWSKFHIYIYTYIIIWSLRIQQTTNKPFGPTTRKLSIRMGKTLSTFHHGKKNRSAPGNLWPEVQRCLQAQRNHGTQPMEAVAEGMYLGR